MGGLFSCYSTSRNGKQTPTAEKGRSWKSCKRRRRSSRYSSSISYDPSSSSSSCNSNDSSKSTSRMVISRKDESVKMRSGLRISSNKIDKHERDEDDKEISIKASMTVNIKDADEMDNCSNNVDKRNNDEDDKENSVTASRTVKNKEDDEMNNGSNNVDKRNNDEVNKEKSVKASMTVNIKDDDQIDNCSNKEADDIASDNRINKNISADSSRNCKNLDLGRDTHNNKENNDNYCSNHEKDIHDQGILNDRTTQESTSKLLLDCLAEFLVRKHNANGLKGFEAPDVCAWMRKVDGALLREGWQTASFLNSSSLVLIFLLVRDLPPRADMRTREFRSHVLACLYLTYSFSGPEITYPCHHFLAKGGCHFFWERVLMLVNQHSTDMLRLYREPEFHRKVLCELKTYSSRLSFHRKLRQ